MPQRNIWALIIIGVLCVVGLTVARISPLSHGVDPKPSSTPIIASGKANYDMTCGIAGTRLPNPLDDGPSRGGACLKYGDMLERMNLHEWHLSHDAYVADQESVRAGRITDTQAEANEQKRIAEGHYKRWDEWNNMSNGDCKTDKGYCYPVDQIVEWKRRHPDATAPAASFD